MKDEQKKTGKEKTDKKSDKKVDKVEVDKEADEVEDDVELPDFVSIIAYMADAGYRVDAIREVPTHIDNVGNTVRKLTELIIRKQGDKV